MIVGICNVVGHSMSPTLNPNDRILISFAPYFIRNPKLGDIVVFVHKSKKIIKRIKMVKKDRYLVKGDNQNDSKNFGWIRKEDIRGKYIFKL